MIARRAWRSTSSRRFEVLMLDGHFDYGNGYHGPVLEPAPAAPVSSTTGSLARSDLL